MHTALVILTVFCMLSFFYRLLLIMTLIATMVFAGSLIGFFTGAIVVAHKWMSGGKL